MKPFRRVSFADTPWKVWSEERSHIWWEGVQEANGKRTSTRFGGNGKTRNNGVETGACDRKSRKTLHFTRVGAAAMAGLPFRDTLHENVKS